MNDLEKLFDSIVPAKSVLGREFHALQFHRDKCRRAYESDPDKLSFDTRPYRAAEIAIRNFLEEMLPRIQRAMDPLVSAKENLEKAEEDAQRLDWPNNGIRLNRRSEQIIWTRFAIERYYLALPKTNRQKLRIYDPSAWHTLRNKWRAFRKEIKRWQLTASSPFDGSQAMSAMFDFLIYARTFGVCRD